MSRAQIILRNAPTHPWLPLANHGQGLQSLSIIFLFQAFVAQLLVSEYLPESAPLLVLEEPETHLHPQAARTLWTRIQDLPGQKVLSTHSPYFLQKAPFRSLRLVSMGQNGTEVQALPAAFSCEVPPNAAMQAIVTANPELQYTPASSTLTVAGTLHEKIYRALLTAYGNHPDRAIVHAALKDLEGRARRYVSNTELSALETFARRIRGEIFFARRWFLVEGQAEFHLAQGLGRASGYNLDEHGVAVIDVQNNGNPWIFAVLARALGIPWIAVFDGDSAGKKYQANMVRHGFDKNEVRSRCFCHAAGNLEDQLLGDGIEQELREILVKIGYPNALTIALADVKQLLEKEKTSYTAELAARFETDPNLAAKMPPLFRAAIAALPQLK